MTDNGYHFGKTHGDAEKYQTEPHTVGIRKSFRFDKSSNLGKQIMGNVRTEIKNIPYTAEQVIKLENKEITKKDILKENQKIAAV
jgi:hypothetical protein